jgi:hypothetical protein
LSGLGRRPTHSRRLLRPSANASRFVEYRITGTLDLVPPEDHRKQFERPGLLARILRGEDYRGSQDPK